jgi:hypothetical protein
MFSLKVQSKFSLSLLNEFGWNLQMRLNCLTIEDFCDE